MQVERELRKDRLKQTIEFALITILAGGVFGTAFVVWKRASDRAGCILNIRNVQQAVRSYSGMKGQMLGDPLDWPEIIGSGKFLDRPVCPGGGTYRFKSRNPAIGVLAMECSLCAAPDRHEPPSHAGW